MRRPTLRALVLMLLLPTALGACAEDPAVPATDGGDAVEEEMDDGSMEEEMDDGSMEEEMDEESTDGMEEEPMDSESMDDEM